MSIPERPAQLLLLQDSLIKLKDYEVCFKNSLSHCCLEDVLHCIRGAISNFKFLRELCVGPLLCNASVEFQMLMGKSSC